MPVWQTDGVSLQEPSEEKASLKGMIKKQIIRFRRQGAWFRLTKAERSILSLAVNLRVKIQSFELIKAIVGILKKLNSLSESVHSLYLRGVKIAWAFSLFASDNGHKAAYKWRTDKNYIIYLALCMP